LTGPPGGKVGGPDDPAGPDAPGAGDAAEIAALRAARDAVLQRIAAAAGRAGRDPASVTLVAVSKTVPPSRLRAAVAAGLTLLGENRVQEAESKAPLVAGARWHLVGPLQSNKARRAVDLFETIESVDSIALAARLDRLVREARGLDPEGPVARASRLPILLQVNVDADPGKAGLAPGEVEDAVVAAAGSGALEVAGLMTIGRVVATAEAARPTFAALRTLSERLRAAGLALGPALSMGMSDDFPVAVEEGATIVRVGRAPFGARP
jgi:pyridoxal phosphate enzyme (YggS family)